jgi:hypothetical protein
MMDYKFKLLAADLSVQRVCDIPADNDEDACEMASDFLAVSECQSVEVRLNGELICRALALGEVRSAKKAKR